MHAKDCVSQLKYLPEAIQHDEKLQFPLRNSHKYISRFLDQHNNNNLSDRTYLKERPQWCKAYQGTKHYRLENLALGTGKASLQALGALYLLCLYAKNLLDTILREGLRNDATTASSATTATAVTAVTSETNATAETNANAATTVTTATTATAVTNANAATTVTTATAATTVTTATTATAVTNANAATTATTATTVTTVTTAITATAATTVTSETAVTNANAATTATAVTNVSSETPATNNIKHQLQNMTIRSDLFAPYVAYPKISDIPENIDFLDNSSFFNQEELRQAVFILQDPLQTELNLIDDELAVLENTEHNDVLVDILKLINEPSLLDSEILSPKVILNTKYRYKYTVRCNLIKNTPSNKHRGNKDQKFNFAVSPRTQEISDDIYDYKKLKEKLKESGLWQ